MKKILFIPFFFLLLTCAFLPLGEAQQRNPDYYIRFNGVNYSLRDYMMEEIDTFETGHEALRTAIELASEGDSIYYNGELLLNDTLVLSKNIDLYIEKVFLEGDFDAVVLQLDYYYFMGTVEIGTIDVTNASFTHSAVTVLGSTSNLHLKIDLLRNNNYEGTGLNLTSLEGEHIASCIFDLRWIRGFYYGIYANQVGHHLTNSYMVDNEFHMGTFTDLNVTISLNSEWDGSITNFAFFDALFQAPIYDRVIELNGRVCNTLFFNCWIWDIPPTTYIIYASEFTEGIMFKNCRTLFEETTFLDSYVDLSNSTKMVDCWHQTNGGSGEYGYYYDYPTPTPTEEGLSSQQELVTFVIVIAIVGILGGALGLGRVF